MHPLQLRLPLRAALFGNAISGLLLRQPWPRQTGIAAGNATVESFRFASVKAQGAYKLKNKKTLPKKLGAKRVGDQYVLPGTIIFKQRGTIWHAGENAILGRDHTIHAAVAGYVKYYRDPARHPDRQYIGVTFERGDKLPYSPQAARKRRLGMVAVARKAVPAFEPMSKSGIPRRIIRREGVVELGEELGGGEEPAGSPDAAAAAAVQAAEAAAADEAPEAAAASSSSSSKKGRGTKASRAARRWNAYMRIKRSNRMLFLGKNYSYHESNFQIGRLMGTHKGKTPGTQRYGSRHSLLRHRRKKRNEQRRQMKVLKASDGSHSKAASSSSSSSHSPKAADKAPKSKSAKKRAA